MSLALWVPIVGLFALASLFAFFSVAIAPLVGPRRYNKAKLDAYECGIEPTPQPIGGGRFPAKFSLPPLLVTIFDIEIIFLYPGAVSFTSLGLVGFAGRALFLATSFAAYAYA